MLPLLLGAMAPLAWLSGCDGASAVALMPSADASADAAVDAPVDAPVDVLADVGVDVPVDAGVDAAADVPVDRGVDTGPDVPACDAGLASCGGACVDPGTSLAHCGSCGHACSAPLHGVAACSAGACAFTCEATYARSGEACVRIEPPRLVAPLTSALVTSRRPRLRWSLAAATDGAVVELCADRACARVLGSYEVTGSSTNPTADLPPGVVFWRARGRAGATAGTTASPVWSFLVGVRSAPVDTSWGTAFDPDGDGRSDLAVGVPNRAMSTGRVLVYPSAGTGYAATPSLTLDGRDGVNAVYGHAVASAGDVDGDGYVDLAVGAYRASSGLGRVYLYAGGAAGLGATPATTINGRDGADGDFGVAVAGVGDVNGDGYADVVAGASTASRLTGRAHAFLGSATGLSTTPATSLDGARRARRALRQRGRGRWRRQRRRLRRRAGGRRERAHRDRARVPVPGRRDGAPDRRSDGAHRTRRDARQLRRVHRRAPGTSTATATPTWWWAPTAWGASRVACTSTSAARRASPRPHRRPSWASPEPTATSAPRSRGWVISTTTATPSSRRSRTTPPSAAGCGFYAGSAAGLVTSGATLIAAPDGLSSGFGSALRGAGDVNGDGIADLVISASQAASQAGRAYLFPGSASGVMATPGSMITSAEERGAGFGTALAAASGR